MDRYRNTLTGAIIDTTCELSGENWEKVVTVEKEVKEVETTETEEVETTETVENEKPKGKGRGKKDK